MREEYDFSVYTNERQIKDRVRFLSDKLESIFNKLKPQLDEFNLIRDELEKLLEYSNNVTEEK